MHSSFSTVGCLAVLGSLALACSADGSDGSSGGAGAVGGQGTGATGATSSGGSASACQAGQTQCGAECVDLVSNPSHCGACNTPCAAGQSCANSQCACLAGLTSCAGACVNLQSDGDNCGNCGTACGAGQLCSAGLCGTTCTVPGQTPCGTSCVDLMTDAANCGTCGIACGTGQECASGGCVCPTGLTLCDGACIDTSANINNCGACGVVCAAGQTCQSGACQGSTGTGGAGTGGASTGGAATGGSLPTGGHTPTGGSTPTGGAGTGGQGAGGATGGAPPATELPCDIYAEGNTPCVGAYSMVRQIASDYSGPLYQVRRGAPNPYENTGSGGTTQDIFATAEGLADAAAQDAFCGSEACTVSVLYDQSGTGNDLVAALGGCYDGGDGAALDDDYESDATRQPLTVGGHNVYGLYMNPHEGYRNDEAVGTAEGLESQGVYMVADGTHAGSACCWDFGTADRGRCWGPTGVMAALMFGWGYWGTGAGAGPWMMGDFELGVWTGGSFPSWGMDDQPGPAAGEGENLDNPSLRVPYAFGILTTGPSNYVLRMGDATTGDLTSAWDGPTAITWDLQGAIILGVGGDNSNWSFGTFFEGAITAGQPSATIDEAIYQNVRAARYGE
jgi:hypothetical protein